MVNWNVTDDRLSVYLEMARRNGVEQTALTALMLLLATYVGQPNVSAAMAVAPRIAGR